MIIPGIFISLLISLNFSSIKQIKKKNMTNEIFFGGGGDFYKFSFFKIYVCVHDNKVLSL